MSLFAQNHEPETDEAIWKLTNVLLFPTFPRHMSALKPPKCKKNLKCSKYFHQCRKQPFWGLNTCCIHGVKSFPPCVRYHRPVGLLHPVYLVQLDSCFIAIFRLLQETLPHNADVNVSLQYVVHRRKNPEHGVIRPGTMPRIPYVI